MGDPQSGARPAAPARPVVQGLAVGDRRAGRPAEDRALAVGLRLLLGAVVNLLEDPRDREQEGGAEGGQVGQQVRDVGRMPDDDAVLDTADLDDPGQHVRQRQEEQRRAPGHAEDLRAGRAAVADLGQHVAVRQLAALGPPGGTRRVDDGGQVAGGGGGYALAHHVVTHGLTVGGQGVQAGGLAARLLRRPADGRGRQPGLDAPDMFQGTEPVAQPGNDPLVRHGLHEDRLGAGVAHDPLDLLGRGCLVDRHADRACGPDRVVDDRPLVPRAGHQADPVAGSDPGGDQPLGQGRHLIAELADRDVLPASCAAGAAQRDLLRIGGGAPGYDLGEAGRIGDLHESWDGVLTHEAVSLSRALAAAAHVIA